MDEFGVFVRNKAILIAQGYSQEEDIDFDKIYAPVARSEAIRMFLAFAYFKNFKIYQIDVKSIFLNGFLPKKYMLSNLPILKIQNFSTIFSN